MRHTTAEHRSRAPAPRWHADAWPGGGACAEPHRGPRAPGCDRPATQADLDHTIPYADGGATYPSNLKCVCRTHYVVKT